MKPVIATILLLCTISSSNAQVLYSNSALLFISNGGVVHVNGGIECAQSTNLTNNGSLTTTKNASSLLPGTLKNGLMSVIGGSGQYYVEQDWINNGLFTASTSTVTLNGNTQQFITSDNNVSTIFNNLILTGTGLGNNRKKTLQFVNASTSITGVLTINNRELETQTNSFFVNNPSTSAVVYDNTFGAEGFVSSIQPGNFLRQTNLSAPYIFPTGSSNIVTRFRPVQLTPQNNTSAQFSVRFNNYDANIDTYLRNQTDGNVCALDSLYYHSIERVSGTTAVDIKLFFVSVTDGTWTGISHWRTTAPMWYDAFATNSGASGGFSTLTSLGWNFTNPGTPYILSAIKPGPPNLFCPTICENSNNNVFAVNGGSGNFQWTVPSNGTIVSGQGTDSIFVNWTSGTGLVSVVDLGTNSCTSQPANCTPTVLTSPLVQFDYSGDGEEISFVDQSSGSTTWHWDFGDGNSDTSQNPNHTYSGDSETYQVTLIITNANGCVGSGTKTVELFHDINVPNIITPNNDGINDAFFIKTAGIKSYQLVIVNRWGNVVFKSTDPQIIWDGTIDGQQASEGVYFYTLNVSSSTKDYKFQGNVTLIRN